MARITYPTHKKWVANALHCLDTLLRYTVGLFPPPPPAQRVSKILVCNLAHLGDVVLTTSLFPAIRALYPHAEIGMLVGSWSRCVVEGHPALVRVHTLDHWKLQRAALSRPQKLRRYWQTRHSALKELRAVGYDCALACNTYFPNGARLLGEAGILLRIGFSSAGLSPFLTHALPWDAAENISMAQVMQTLLQPLHPGPLPTVALRAQLYFTPQPKENTVVLHMGAGAAHKRWTEAGWRGLTLALVKRGYTLYFTGMGASEQEAAQRVCAGLAGARNVCGQLSWQEFVQQVQRARLLVGMDSVAAHVAAAVGTPVVALTSRDAPPAVWRPLSDACTQLFYSPQEPLPLQAVLNAVALYTQ